MSAPLVLLPGLMCDARLFGPQAGLGASVPVPVADSTAAMADMVLAAAPERFALGGLSMGGIVAMEVVARAPERVTRLALMDTNARAEHADVAARRPAQVAAARDGRLREVMRDELKPRYLARGPRRAEVLDLCMAMALDLGPEVFAAQSAALAGRADRRDALRAYPGPVLALCGAEDALCPVFRHEEIAALAPRGRLVVVEGAGHLPTLERPRETEAALRAWLAE